MKYINFLIKYKLLISLGVPLLFVAIVLASSFSGNNDQAKTSKVNISQIRNSTKANKAASSDETTNPIENDENSLDDRYLQNKETLPNGLTKSYFNSPVANRQNIIIANIKEEILFQRSVIDPEFPVKS